MRFGSQQKMQCTRADNLTAVQEPSTRLRRTGFSLLEVLTALAVLAFVSSSVLLVIDRCVVSAGDSAMRMEAFQLVHENMEKILASESVEETIEYGRSEKYPDITWQTAIEPFAEPITGTMWIRAVCSAEYRDAAGDEQTVELEHWLTELTDQQANQLGGEPQSIEELTAEQLIATPEEAAEYAGVSEEILEEWIGNGLVATADGAFIKHNIDIFARSDGRPTRLERERQVQSIEELATLLNAQRQNDQGTLNEQRGADGKDPLTGLPQEQLEKMDISDVVEMLGEKKRR